MGDTDSYHVAFSTNYDSSLKALVKGYYKKDRRGAEAALGLVERLLAVLSFAHSEDGAEDPLCFIKHEGWPGSLRLPDWEFRKLYFDLPALKYGAREGRLMFLVNHEEKTVLVLWVYNHDQYAKRPPDQHIETVIKQAMEDAKRRREQD